MAEAVPLHALPWLAPPPEGFGRVCREAGDAPALRRLARFRLGLNHLHALASAWRKLDPENRSGAGLRPLSVGLLGGATLDLLPDALAASGLRRGLDLSVAVSPYGQFVQSTLTPPAGWPQQTDVVVLMLDQAALPWSMPGAARPDPPADEAFAAIRRAIDNVRVWHDGALVVTTLADPAVPFLGSADLLDTTSPRAVRQEVNRRLAKLAADGEIRLLDVAGMAAAALFAAVRPASGLGRGPGLHDGGRTGVPAAIAAGHVAGIDPAVHRAAPSV